MKYNNIKQYFKKRNNRHLFKSKYKTDAIKYIYICLLFSEGFNDFKLL